MLSWSNASPLLPPALNGAEGEAEGYAKTIWRPAASTLSKTGTGQAPSAQVLGANSSRERCRHKSQQRERFPLIPYIYVRIYQYRQNVPRGTLLHFRSEEHTSELQSHSDLVCRLLLE